MAFVATPGWKTPYPANITKRQAQTPVILSSQINDTAEKVAYIFRAPSTGNLKQAGFLINSVGQAPVNGLQVSFQDLSSGDPDGTADQFRVVPQGSVSAGWVESGIISDDGTDVGTLRAVTKGDFIALVVEFDTFAAGDDVTLGPAVRGSWVNTNDWGVPRTSHFTSSWVDTIYGTGDLPNFALQYDDDVWVRVEDAVAVSSITTVSVTATTDPDEIGMSFTCPYAMKVGGFFADMYVQNTSATFDFHLYDSDDVELAVAVVDTTALTNFSQAQALNAVAIMKVEFDGAEVELTAGSTYRVTCEATSTGTIRLYRWTLGGSNYENTSPWGNNADWTQREQGDPAWAEPAGDHFTLLGLLATGFAEEANPAGGDVVIINRRYD